MVDYTVALGVKPLDVATPLMQAAKIRQAEQETQMQQIQMHRDLIGSEARGLAPYFGSPDYDQRRQAAAERLSQQGVLSHPAAVQGWERDTSSPLGLNSIIARTQTADQAFRADEAKRAQSNTDRTFAEGKRQFDITSEKPVSVAPGTELVTPQGKKVYGDSSSTLYSPEELSQLANQARAGDTTVLQNARIGNPQNLTNLRKEIVRQNSDAGESGSEQAMRNAEFFGVKSGQRTLGTKQANIELAATEFNQVLPIVVEASNAVNRTNYPDLNKIIQAFEQKTGDPSIVKFGGGINTLVNLYARAISPSGVGTVSDKEHAREILQKSWSQGQFNAAVGMMKQEIDAALASPEKVRDDMRKRFIGGVQGGSPAAVPSATSPSANIPQPAIDMLKKDPKSAEKFDAIFGVGQAAKILGVK